MDSLYNFVPSTKHTRLTLDTLPDDILFEVAALCRPDPRRLVPRIFSAIHALSMVNRHFHVLAALLLWRGRIFPSMWNFRQAVRRYNTAEGGVEARAMR